MLARRNLRGGRPARGGPYAHGIRFTLTDDDRVEIDAPRDALTSDVLAGLKNHKGELLAILRRDPEAPAIDPPDATQVWQAALDRLEGDSLFPPDVMEGLRAADPRRSG